MKLKHPPGPVMLDLQGTALAPEDRDKLMSPAAGGVILFSRNYQSPEQAARLIADIRATRPELLIAVDHEGGRVQRFREDFTRLPAAARYQAARPESPAAAHPANIAGWLMAAELRALDVDFSFAPVLDVESGVSQVIGDRAFADDPATATALALEFVQGMRRAGMAAVGKHFPGHGGVVEDSHLALPIDRRSLAELENRDLRPFNALIAAGIEGIMPAHVVYEQIDAQPAGFSPFWLREVLRRRLGFGGAVFSDDLSMAGAAYAGGYLDRARLALEAGCDMVLVCNAPQAAEQTLEALSGAAPDPERAARLQRMRGRFPFDRAALLNSAEWREASRQIASLSD
jgi:beta-N-acetylhexosaminidase